MIGWYSSTFTVTIFIPHWFIWLMILDVKKLAEVLGEPYSAMLGIDLRKGDPAYSKWFLAAFLYAKPIREESATRTYRVFESHGLTTARAITATTWDRLVELLGKGGYTRYDDSTATRLLAIFGHLLDEYGGRLSQLYKESKDSRDLEVRIRELGKGIGPVTISVFLRDMRMVWPRADPEPTPRVMETAKALGIDDVKKYANSSHLDLIRLETALHRYSRQIRKPAVPASK